jgi:hypothetical protein
MILTMNMMMRSMTRMKKIAAHPKEDSDLCQEEGFSRLDAWVQKPGGIAGAAEDHRREIPAAAGVLLVTADVIHRVVDHRVVDHLPAMEVGMATVDGLGIPAGILKLQKNVGLAVEAIPQVDHLLADPEMEVEEVMVKGVGLEIPVDIHSLRKNVGAIHPAVAVAVPGRFVFYQISYLLFCILII